jgi:hypothetical protein
MGYELSPKRSQLWHLSFVPILSLSI